MVSRRAFLGVVTGGLLAAPLFIEAQQAGKVYRVSVLSPGSSQAASSEIPVLRQSLRELGYIEHQNIRIDWYFAEARSEGLSALAAEVVRLRPDLIFTINTPATTAAKAATSTIPIVFVRCADPVASGLVRSLARPGGNLTGMASSVMEMSGKRLELLKEAIPRLARVAVLWHSLNEAARRILRELEGAGSRLRVQIQDVGVREAHALPSAFEAAAKGRASAMVVIDDLVIASYQTRILELATKHRMGVASIYRGFADAGGLMAYGPSFSDTYRRAAIYVDKILKGGKPADLPIEQPEKFDLVINLKTAKALGLTIPPALLQRADQVIE
jgi:putative ABC transport system substrate-binding protein